MHYSLKKKIFFVLLLLVIIMGIVMSIFLANKPNTTNSKASERVIPLPQRGAVTAYFSQEVPEESADGTYTMDILLKTHPLDTINSYTAIIQYPNNQVYYYNQSVEYVSDYCKKHNNLFTKIVSEDNSPQTGTLTIKKEVPTLRASGDICFGTVTFRKQATTNTNTVQITLKSGTQDVVKSTSKVALKENVEPKTITVKGYTIKGNVVTVPTQTTSCPTSFTQYTGLDNIKLKLKNLRTAKMIEVYTFSEKDHEDEKETIAGNFIFENIPNGNYQLCAENTSKFNLACSNLNKSLPTASCTNLKINNADYSTSIIFGFKQK